MADLRHVTPNRLTIVARRGAQPVKAHHTGDQHSGFLLVAALIHPLAGLASLTWPSLW